MLRLASLTVVAALVAAGCGASEPGPAPAAPPTTDAETTEPAPAPPEPASTSPIQEPTKTPKALPGLPPFTAGYRTFVKLNASPIPPRETGDAHLGTKNVFASKPIAANGRFPNGTIVVKEASRPGKDFIGLIATMRKVKGADPAHNGWVFVEYAREAPNEPFAVLARDSVCWGCHAGARETDYVFTVSG